MTYSGGDRIKIILIRYTQTVFIRYSAIDVKRQVIIYPA